MKSNTIQNEYKRLVARKIIFLIILISLTVILAIYAIVIGSSNLSFSDVFKTLIGKG